MNAHAPMNVLVTGGAGFIGSHIADAYLARGHRVLILDDFSTGQRSNIPAGAVVVRASVTDRNLQEILRAHAIDVVNHHAAQANVRKSLEAPEIDAEVNVFGTVNLLAAAARSGVKRFIFASTAGALYGETERRPTPETAPCLPESPYGVSKLAAEGFVSWAHAQGRITTVILRYANVYGPRQNALGEAGVVAIFAHALRRRSAIRIFGDGEQTRDFVYVRDVVRVNVAALTRGDGGIYNVGTGCETSVNKLYAHLAALVGVNTPPAYAAAVPGELRHSAVDSTCLERALAIRCEVSIDDGLAQTVASVGA